MPGPFEYRTSPIYEHPHLRTGGRRALTRTCEQSFTLRTWVSPSGRSPRTCANRSTRLFKIMFRVPNKRPANGNLKRNPFVSCGPPVLGKKRTTSLHSYLNDWTGRSSQYLTRMAGTRNMASRVLGSALPLQYARNRQVPPTSVVT
jgi:hypothetical protein